MTRPIAKTEPDEIIIIDKFTAEPLAAGPPATDSDLSPVEILEAEHHTPEGSPGIVHEHRATPWLIGGLAFSGLLIVGLSMFAVGGVQAMAVGMVWLCGGYAAAWSVVWGAGLLRARDEVEIEDQLHQQHGHLTVK